LLALLESGDHVVCGRSVYGGTVRLLNQVLPGLGVRSTFVDTTDPAAVARALRPETRLVFVETPSNPTLEVSDLRSIASLSQDAGALLAVDNTFQTAVLQQPLALGADLSVYSTTKFVEGHSLALGGAVVSRHETVLERLRFLRKCTGAIQSPFNAWVTLNGLKTLPIRLERQSRNAAEIARWLDAHPAVRLVHYPGLATEGVRRLAESQHGHGTDGEAPLHGAVLSFELEGGLEAARVVAESLRLAALVEHVGSVNTLVTHPATMTHADVPADHRRACGIADGLLRLSVGIEPAAAIRADLHQALEAVGAGAASSDPNPGEVLACPRP
jgi:cystathionine beta-lyase/cystathionine gamma-synthase